MGHTIADAAASSVTKKAIRKYSFMFQLLVDCWPFADHETEVGVVTFMAVSGSFISTDWPLASEL